MGKKSIFQQFLPCCFFFRKSCRWWTNYFCLSPTLIRREDDFALQQVFVSMTGEARDFRVFFLPFLTHQSYMPSLFQWKYFPFRWTTEIRKPSWGSYQVVHVCPRNVFAHEARQSVDTAERERFMLETVFICCSNSRYFFGNLRCTRLPHEKFHLTSIIVSSASSSTSYFAFLFSPKERWQNTVRHVNGHEQEEWLWPWNDFHFLRFIIIRMIQFLWPFTFFFRVRLFTINMPCTERCRKRFQEVCVSATYGFMTTVKQICLSLRPVLLPLFVLL